jgi:2-dehydro-3-deoxyphosphogluconate aldolase / (4S)-4-hydroxy-2-oxoglutarate aldolase
MLDTRKILERAPVIPVVTIGDAAHAVPIGEALLGGGIGIIEVTLRSEAAFAAIERLRERVPELWVGAGTVWTSAQAAQAAGAGAQFLVSPGIAEDALASGVQLGLPFLPGAQTVSEIASLRRRGFRAVKFFPAGPAGGVAALASFAAVFPGISFCPTGGISAATAPDYLALDCVPCVGGSWLTSSARLAAQDWRAVATAAAEASALRRG